jgi:RNA polymerase sigma-70 factor (ECF subfamily)
MAVAPPVAPRVAHLATTEGWGADQPLLELLKGDGADIAPAFAQLYRRYRGRLLRHVTSKVGDAHLGEEIVQEAFARAWKAAGRFGGADRFYGWLCTIADRICVDHWRHARNRVEMAGEPLDAPPAGEDSNDPELALVFSADVHDALAALGQLPARYQELLRLREMEGLTYREIASRLETTEAAVETALFRARGALRSRYRQLVAVTPRP